MKHTGFFTITLCSLLFLLIGCISCTTTGNVSGSRAAKVLKVGITTNSPPMAYREGREVTGLEADFARGLAEFAGKELQFVEIGWEDQIPALLDYRTDIIMSAMSVTRLRRYRINFADPYMITGQISLVRMQEVNRFQNGFTDLLNPTVKIGTVEGTTGDYFVLQNRARGERTAFKNAQKGVQALINKKIDAFVYDLPMNFHFGAIYADKGLAPVVIPLTREQVAWGIRKDDVELLNMANSYLASLKESKELPKLIQRWIPFYKNVFNN